MYQRVGQVAYKADLDNTFALARYLDNPEQGFKSVHVAGTNGKGSTSHLIASVLQEAGYRVGLYTSPHLKDFRERIKINGEMIPKRKVSAFVKMHRTFFEVNKLSFFEMTVGLAFDYFRREKVDIAIIEVGLGGRLDSTNIILPEVSVITNIGIDHTLFLGNTLVDIAREKAGIIKPETPVVIGETTSETKKVFSEISTANNAPIIFAEEAGSKEYESDLKGDYQAMNIRTARVTIAELQKQGWEISESHIRKGFLHTVKNTELLGRWQLLQSNPKVICDAAHNKEGLLCIMKQLSSTTYNKLHIVLGMVNDKDLDRVLSLFPKEAAYYFCKPDVARGLDAKILAKTAQSFGMEGAVYMSVQSAYESAIKHANYDDLIYVGGSTFVVAEIL